MLGARCILLRKRTSLSLSTQHKLGAAAATSLTAAAASTEFKMLFDKTLRSCRTSSQVLNRNTLSRATWHSTSMCTGGLILTTVPVRLRPWCSNKIAAPTQGNSGVLRCLWARPRSDSDKRPLCLRPDVPNVPCDVRLVCTTCGAFRTGKV